MSDPSSPAAVPAAPSAPPTAAAGAASDPRLADLSRQLQTLTQRAEAVAQRAAQGQTLGKIAGYVALALVIFYGVLFWQIFARGKQMIMGDVGDITESPLAHSVKANLEKQQVLQKTQALMQRTLEKALPQLKEALANEIDMNQGLILESYIESLGQLDDVIQDKFEDDWRLRVRKTVAGSERMLRDALPPNASSAEIENFVEFLHVGLVGGIVDMFADNLNPVIVAIEQMGSNLEKFEGLEPVAGLSDAELEHQFKETLKDLAAQKAFPRALGNERFAPKPAPQPVEEKKPEPPAEAQPAPAAEPQPAPA
ncbi:MAG: hypothetical protein HZA54_19580, partial [Planctomycetes bacterium]|nr:hypothetical protein [Planctomycetota bacterium]